MKKQLTYLAILLATTGWVIPENLPPRAPPSTISLARAIAGLPTSFDWRDSGHITPVKNQGPCGSCWAFASLAPMEFKLSSMNKQFTDLSEQIILNYSGAGDCKGGYMSATAVFLTQVGDTIESCARYSATYDENEGACDNWDKNTYRYYSWDYIYPVDSVEVVKNVVYDQGPVAVVFALFRDFYDYSGGIYTHQSGEFVGYHAVVVVGWSDTEEYLIAKNSWGSGWGEQGYFRIAYSEVGSPATNFAYQIYYYDDAYFAYPVKAVFDIKELEGFVPFTIDLTANQIGTIDHYLWDFGDGDLGEGREITHTFNEPNIYEVVLTVVNDIDGSDQTSATFRAKPPPDPMVQRSGGGGGGCFISIAQFNAE